MKQKILFTAAVFSIAVLIAVVLSISIEKKKAISPLEGYSETARIADESGSPADTFTLYNLTDTPAPEVLPTPSIDYDTITVDHSHVTAVAVLDGRAVAGTEGGLFFYDPVDSSIELVSALDGLREYRVTALEADGQDLYIGTESGLYVRDYLGENSPLAPEIDDRINTIVFQGEHLLIGTENYGLVRITDGVPEPIFDACPIEDVVAESDRIHVSVPGDGLYTYDGTKWNKRFLEIDSTAFDFASALGYNYNRLFVGTPDGLWVFDGGRWKLYDPDDGLFDCDITAISFKGWKILAGTRGWGHFEIFEDVVTPMYWTEAIQITSLDSDGELVVVGTEKDGIFVQRGKEVHTVNPGPGEIEIPVFASHFM